MLPKSHSNKTQISSYTHSSVPECFACVYLKISINTIGMSLVVICFFVDGNQIKLIFSVGISFFML